MFAAQRLRMSSQKGLVYPTFTVVQNVIQGPWYSTPFNFPSNVTSGNAVLGAFLQEATSVQFPGGPTLTSPLATDTNGGDGASLWQSNSLPGGSKTITLGTTGNALGIAIEVGGSISGGPASTAATGGNAGSTTQNASLTLHPTYVGQFLVVFYVGEATLVSNPGSPWNIVGAGTDSFSRCVWKIATSSDVSSGVTATWTLRNSWYHLLGGVFN